MELITVDAAVYDAHAVARAQVNGEYRTVVQDSAADLRPGNRVRVVDGRVYRY